MKKKKFLSKGKYIEKTKYTARFVQYNSYFKG